MDTTDEFSPLAPPDETTPDWFPDLGSMSPGFLFRFVPVPDMAPGPPEYVYLRQPEGRQFAGDRLKFDLTITEWNSLWEAGPLTSQVINPKRIPKQLRWLRKVGDRNLRLVPRMPDNRYDAYAPLYHLLPAGTLRSVGLPLLKRGLWPHWVHRHGWDGCLPSDFDARLAEAFSRHIWPLVNDRSARYAFADRDPLRVLSHHLDFWLPYIDLVAQRRMRANGRCEKDIDDDHEALQRDLRKFNEANAAVGVQAKQPWRGGHLWIGEEEAWEATRELIEVADEHGALRGIIDAVKTNRVQDDFSSVWSYEREDFERKFHRKRSKIKVVFVEMPDTVPIYSEDTEVHERLLWGDFLTLLDAKERRVTVCLRRGTIGAVNIAKELGYANHSPVSKALARIRRKASDFFDNN